MSQYENDGLIYEEGFQISSQIANLYLQLSSELDDDSIRERLNEIKKLLSLEDNVYEKLSLVEVISYLECIDMVEVDNRLAFLRYKLRLTFQKGMFSYPVSMINGFESSSFILGTVIVNTLIMMNKRINEMVTYDLEELTLLEDLKNEFFSFKFEMLSLSSFSEKYLLKYDGDLNISPEIDLENIHYDKYNLVYMSEAIRIVETLANSAEIVTSAQILSNLYDNICLEIWLSMLDETGLILLLRFCNSHLLDKEDIPQVANVRKLIRRKIEELNS